MTDDADADGGVFDAPESGTGGDGEAADAFAALSDPLRVAIVETLADRYWDHPEEPSLPFSEIRRRCGVRDSGRFRYHLNELRGRFVEKVDGEYRLTFAGREVATAVAAGRYTERERLGPVDLDAACDHCGTAVSAAYENGTVRVTCREGHPLFVWNVPPNAAGDAGVEELLEVAQVQLRQNVEMALLGRCPGCFESMATTVETREDATPRHRFEAECGTCGSRLLGPAGYCLLADHDVAAFYRRHDRPIRDAYVWELAFADDAAVTPLGDREDAAVRFEVELDGERLCVLVDDGGHVAETATEPVE